MIGALALAGALAASPTGASQQAKVAAASPSGDPLLIGRSNLPSEIAGQAETTRLVAPNTSRLAPRLFQSANYSTGDIGDFFSTATYRIAVLGSTSGPDNEVRVRIGVAGAVDASLTGSQGGAGVYGYATGPDANGLFGASVNGYGASLEGGMAPLRLVPGATAGAPTAGNHLIGELYLGATGDLFLCVESGTPGRWTRLNAFPSFVPAVMK